MTFIIVVAVREGIVMASDSRITLNNTRQEGEKQVIQMAISQSDSNSKAFLTHSNIGIFTCGDADIQGVPIAGYIESFINEILIPVNYEVDQVPEKLLEYFRKFPEIPKTIFTVAGYKKTGNIFQQHVWEVNVSANIAKRLNNPEECWVSWSGETDVLTRLNNDVAVMQADGTYQPLASYPVEFGFFTLQDAIDYCLYAVRVTIDTMRFQARPKTVGGPVDVLVLKPNEAKWIQKKQLHV
jgi:hypothetical protein